MRKKRGQAAIEFLTTYSWAILIILLMVGALTYFDLFSTDRFISEGCSLGNQLVCVEAALFQEEGDFRLRVLNNHPVDIIISNVVIRRDNQELAVKFDNQPLDRGETKALEIGIKEDFFVNNMETFDVVLTFNRDEGVNSYNVTGRVITRTLPGSAP